MQNSPDICIFYSNPDGVFVESISSILEKKGWSVWRRKEIKHGSWPVHIENKIKNCKCAIPIWNKNALREDSITRDEAEFARVYRKEIVTVISDSTVKPPIQFISQHQTCDISDWDQSEDSECILQLIEALTDILGIPPASWSYERPDFINLRGIKVKTPCFVKSLSSFETQLDPIDGLQIFDVFTNLNEDPDSVLISAYDMKVVVESSKPHAHPIVKRLKALQNKGTFILMDSGNYEKARWKKKNEEWNKKFFLKTLDHIPFTYAFCYDDLEPKGTLDEIVEKVIKSVSGKHSEKLIPIIHAPLLKSGARQFKRLPSLFCKLANKQKFPIIAVPERELGDGLFERAKTVSSIRTALNNSLDFYQPIHLLGTGNPLSIAIFSAAGADFFDGLEWCRTTMDRESGLLLHYQHYDFLINQTVEHSVHPEIQQALTDKKIDFNIKSTLHNLESLDEWMVTLRLKLVRNDLKEMLANKLPDHIYNQLKDALPNYTAQE